jgi:Asp-tRNA(Asn)/Glu-tRNA(Gln) amidotransferase A subunit family amidase
MIVLPLFGNEDDMPLGVLFMDRFGDDAMLFRLASQLETAQPWAHQCPPEVMKITHKVALIFIQFLFR